MFKNSMEPRQRTLLKFLGLSADRRLELKFSMIRGAAAILVSVGVATVLIFLISSTPLLALRYLLLGPFSTERQIWVVFERMIPLMFTGLAVCLMFSANQFNLAADGCVLLGGFVAALCAIYIPMPPVIHVVVCLLAGAAVCALLMLIPALLQTKLGANVMVSTLMLNYVVMYVVQYFLINVVADKTQGTTRSLPFLKTAMIPTMAYQTSWGFVIGACFVAIVGVFMYRTRWGYSIRMVGINQNFSGYSGIKVGGTIVLCQVVGGALAGLGGGVEVLGYYKSFSWRDLTGYGWDGITIAILAKNNPILVPFAAFFLAYLSRGCVLMASNTDVPAEMLDVIQAVILLFFGAEHFLAKYRQRMVVKQAKREYSDIADPKEVRG
ncbi:MAG: ABC transporter permease [Firmicutes bacterium]|nr:ABC transporter permease [Bacillota bacterium]